MKNTLIVLSLLIGLQVKSQDTIKLPYPVAKQIVKDLTSCDSVKAIHEQVKIQLAFTEQKTVAQDTIINTYKLKTDNYIKQIDAEQQKTQIWQDQYKTVAKKCKKLKATLTFTRITLSAVIGFLGYLYITK